MTLIAIVHLLLCLFLIGLVLIQDFKGGAMGVFGGGGSQSIFGASGALLATVLAISFLSKPEKSVFEKQSPQSASSLTPSTPEASQNKSPESSDTTQKTSP